MTFYTCREKSETYSLRAFQEIGEGIDVKKRKVKLCDSLVVSASYKNLIWKVAN